MMAVCPIRKVPTENGLEEIPRFLALAHELAHAFASVKGTKNLEPWFKSGDRTVIKDEFFACIVENWVRMDHDKSMRTHFATMTVNGEGGAKPGLKVI